MKNKKKKTYKTIGNVYSPYSNVDVNDTGHQFEAYSQDKGKHIVIDGKTYFKIINRCEFYIYDSATLLVTIEGTHYSQGDILVDEYGREFVIKAFEMIRFSGMIPEWYGKISTIAIQGESYDIGEYLAIKESKI